MCGLIAAAQASTGSAAEFTYRAQRYPGQTGAACQSAAAGVAKRFADTTGLKVLGSGCELDAVTDFVSLAVRYEAETRVTVPSTHSRGAVYVSPGFYNTQAECEANRSQQETLFEQQTGLKRLVSYCTSTQSMSYKPWYVYIDALGAAQKEPYWLTFRTLTAVYPSMYDVANQLKAELNSRDIIIGNWIMRGNAVDSAFEMLVYGPKLASAGSASLASFRGVEECKVARDQLKEQLDSNYNEHYLVSYCAAGSTSNPQRVELTVLSLDESLDAVYSSEEFASLQSCKANLERLQEAGASLYGARLVATSCGYRTFSSSNEKVRAVYALRPVSSQP